MGEVSTIGLDIAKSVFQVHGVDVDGAVVIRKRITRAKLLEFFAALPSCLVGIEACPTAHYWSLIQGRSPFWIMLLLVWRRSEHEMIPADLPDPVTRWTAHLDEVCGRNHAA